MVDEEKILLSFVYRKGVSWHDIKRYIEGKGIDSQKISDTYFDVHAPEKHLFIESKGLWILTPEGKRRLEDKSFWKENNKKFIITTIIVIISLVTTSLSALYLYNLNISLEEKYNPSLRLTPQSLDITMYDYFKEISAQQLTEKSFLFNRPKFEICIKNFAQIRTDHIHFVLKNDNLTSSDGNIGNIDSMNSSCEYVNVRHKNCDTEKCDVDRNSVPNGTIPLTFEFNCKNCEPQIFNHTFNDICIWRESGSECKK